MDVFVGWFKRAFVQSTGRLIAQLSSGVTFFNYNNVDTDNTEHASENNLTGHGDNINSGQNATVKTTVWIEPVTNRVVSTGFFHNTQTPPSPVSGPALEINIEEESPFVLVGKKYVAKLHPYYKFNGLSYSRDTINICGGTHIQNILGVDHIVAYNLTFLSGGGFKLQKLMGILDLEIDQELIDVLPVVDTIDHVDVDLDMPYQIPGYDGNDELGVNLPRNNRILCCNEDGTKTVFFVLRKDALGEFGTFFPIFELTDDGVSFSVTQVDEFDATTIVITNNSTVDFNSSTTTASAPNCINCSSSLWDDDTGGSGVKSHTKGYALFAGVTAYDHGLNCSYVQNIKQNTTHTKTFLGVAYDRQDDSIIYAHIEFISGDSRDQNDSYSSGNYTHSINYLSRGDSYKLIINDSSTEVELSDDNQTYANLALNWESADIFSYSGTIYEKLLNKASFQLSVVDLSCRVFCTFSPYNVSDGLITTNGTTSNYWSNVPLNVNNYSQGDVNVYVNGLLKNSVVNQSSITTGIETQGTRGFGGSVICLAPTEPASCEWSLDLSFIIP